MRIEPEIAGVSVNLVGSFNPAIFTPAWFALHGLLPEVATDNADLMFAHPQTTAFDAGWLHLEVTPDRFHADTRQAPYILVHDLVTRVFNEHLHHTPLRALGINRYVHFKVKDSTVRNQLGRTLAPVKPWGSWGCELGSDGERGGMTSLTMSQNNPEGRPEGGRINVKIEPSNIVGGGRKGIFMEVNDHYTVDNSEPGTAGRLMDLLEANFRESLCHSEQIIDHIMSLTTNQET